jgi:hypothetical protein
VRRVRRGGVWPHVVGWKMVAWLRRWSCHHRGLGMCGMCLFWAGEINAPKFMRLGLLGSRNILTLAHLKRTLGNRTIQNHQKPTSDDPDDTGAPEDGQPCALLAAPLRSTRGCRWTLCPGIALRGGGGEDGHATCSYIDIGRWIQTTNNDKWLKMLKAC